MGEAEGRTSCARYRGGFKRSHLFCSKGKRRAARSQRKRRDDAKTQSISALRLSALRKRLHLRVLIAVGSARAERSGASGGGRARRHPPCSLQRPVAVRRRSLTENPVKPGCGCGPHLETPHASSPSNRHPPSVPCGCGRGTIGTASLGHGGPWTAKEAGRGHLPLATPRQQI